MLQTLYAISRFFKSHKHSLHLSSHLQRLYFPKWFSTYTSCDLTSFLTSYLHLRHSTRDIHFQHLSSPEMPPISSLSLSCIAMSTTLNNFFKHELARNLPLIITSSVVTTLAIVTLASTSPPPKKIIPSPRETLLPRLSKEEQGLQAYPPDVFPGARDVSSPVSDSVT
jgi:hypothetical protein